LIVNADGLTVDLGGHRLTGAGLGSGVTVLARSRISIRNGTIARFGNGVSLLSGRRVRPTSG
jgi:hypothetical protein